MYCNHSVWKFKQTKKEWVGWLEKIWEFRSRSWPHILFIFSYVHILSLSLSGCKGVRVSVCVCGYRASLEVILLHVVRCREYIQQNQESGKCPIPSFDLFLSLISLLGLSLSPPVIFQSCWGEGERWGGGGRDRKNKQSPGGDGATTVKQRWLGEGEVKRGGTRKVGHVMSAVGGAVGCVCGRVGS